MPTLSNPELAEALEGANSLILRWGHNQMRQLKAEEVERIVAALKASASSETGQSEDARRWQALPAICKEVGIEFDWLCEHLPPELRQSERPLTQEEADEANARWAQETSTPLPRPSKGERQDAKG